MTSPPAVTADTRIPAATEEQAHERASVLAIFGWLAFVVLVVYAVLIGGGWPGIHLVQLRIASLALIALVLGGWWIVSLRVPAWRPATAIWPTLLIPPLVLALSTLTSRMPRLGLEYVAWSILLVALYLFLVRVLDTTTARARIGGLAALLALVVGVAYIVSVGMRWLDWWELVGRLAVPPLRPLFASLTFGTPNTVLTIQVLLAASAAAGLGLGTRGRRITLALVAIVTAVVIVLTGSRAGWLAVAGATVIVGAIWLMAALRDGTLTRLFAPGRLRLLWSRRDVRVFAAVALLGTLALAVIVLPTISARFDASGDGGRSAYFAASLRMFEEAPVLGTGPGTWAVQRAAYTAPTEIDWTIPHAHDIYLQTAAELGIVGLVAGVLALLPVAWLIARGLRRDAASSTRRWAWAALFALVYLGLHQLLDFYANMPAVMLAAVLPVAVLDASSERRFGLGRAAAGPGASAEWTHSRLGRAARAVLWVACLGAIIVLARTESVALTHDRAIANAYAGDWTATRELADAATGEDPDMPAYQVTRGLAASAQQDWPTAAIAYLQAAQADEVPQSWLGVAQAALEVGRPAAEVSEAIERARRLGDQQPAIVYAAGALYDRLAMPAAADAAYADAIAAVPSLAGDPSWTSDPALAPRWDAIREQAMTLQPARAWEIALMTGDADGAREMADEAARPELAHLVIEAWSGDEAAVGALMAQAEALPDEPETLSWAARIASRAGDAAQADRFQRLAIYAVTEGGQLPGTEIRVDPDGWFRFVPAGTTTGYAGHYLYRRPLPPDLMPPGLPRLVNVEP